MNLGDKYGRSNAAEAIAKLLPMPRVQVSVILCLTAFGAFIVSVSLLRAGMTTMAWRYAIAVIAGYVTFLLLLRIWIWWQDKERGSTDLIVDGDIVGIPVDIGLGDAGSGAAKDFAFGGGGDFAGGGAGGSWSDSDVPLPVAASFTSNPGPASSSSSSGLSGLDVDLDDGVALLLVGLILVLVFSALLYVVWIAPILLAELMIDAAVVGSLYKPVKNIDRRYWLQTALRKTGVPALIVLLLFFFAGLIMQAAEPSAVTIGQFLDSVL